MDLSIAARMSPTTPPPAKPVVDVHGAHEAARAAVSTDLTGGEQGAISTETLPNGVRLIVAERPGAKSAKIQVGIGAGSLQDPQGKLGLAHLLEHLAFEGSPTRPATTQEKIRNELGNNWNAYTYDKGVVYYGVVPSKQAKQGAALLTDMFQHPAVTGPQVKQELAAVKNEMVYYGGSVVGEEPDIEARLLHGDDPAVNNVIGTKKSVDAITAKDLRAFHDQHFVGRNTVALVEGNPDDLPLDTIRRELGKLPAGGRIDNGDVQPDVIEGQAMQVVNDPSSETVKINLMLPVSEEQIADLKTPGSLIQTALSERLNTRLRREQDLTYGVGAKLVDVNDDYKMLQVTTNVAKQHARTALTSIVETLRDAQDGFGPKTFETHKKAELSNLRAAEAEPPLTVSDRASLAFDDAIENEDVWVPPATFDDGIGEARAALGKVTAKSFAADMGKLVSFADMKLLATGSLADGGAELRAGLRDAGIQTKGLVMNPVDMQQYKDMGLRVTKDTVPPLK